VIELSCTRQPQRLHRHLQRSSVRPHLYGTRDHWLPTKEMEEAVVVSTHPAPRVRSKIVLRTGGCNIPPREGSSDGIANTTLIESSGFVRASERRNSSQKLSVYLPSRVKMMYLCRSLTEFPYRVGRGIIDAANAGVKRLRLLQRRRGIHTQMLWGFTALRSKVLPVTYSFFLEQENQFWSTPRFRPRPEVACNPRSRPPRRLAVS